MYKAALRYTSQKNTNHGNLNLDNKYDEKRLVSLVWKYINVWHLSVNYQKGRQKQCIIAKLSIYADGKLEILKIVKILKKSALECM